MVKIKTCKFKQLFKKLRKPRTEKLSHIDSVIDDLARKLRKEKMIC